MAKKVKDGSPQSISRRKAIKTGAAAAVTAVAATSGWKPSFAASDKTIRVWTVLNS